MLRKVFVLTKDQSVQILRKLHNKELCKTGHVVGLSLNPSIKTDEVDRACSTHGVYDSMQTFDQKSSGEETALYT